MGTKEFSSAWESCPRAEICNINRCILHEDYNKLQNDESDPSMKHKQKCIPKSIRKKIALKFGLKNRGMTEREKNAEKRWADLPESVKQERIAKLKKVSPVSRLLAVGCKIILPKHNQSPEPHTKDKTSPVEATGEAKTSQTELDFSENLEGAK